MFDTALYYLVLILQNAGKTFLPLAPYVIAGAVVGEILQLTNWAALVSRYMHKSQIPAAILAATLGMISPLCTYGTVPVVLQLYKADVPIIPLIAFLSASSLMNPQLFIITWGGISAEMAVVRVITVFLFVILFCLIIFLIPKSWIVNTKLTRGTGFPTTSNECKTNVSGVKSFIISVFKNLEFVGFYILTGILLGAAVEVLVSEELITAVLKPGQWFSVLLASVAGIPFYACGGASVTVISSLIKEGMSKGAALAYLNVGQATRIPPLMSLAVILRPQFITAYILLLIAFSVSTGMIYH